MIRWTIIICLCILAGVTTYGYYKLDKFEKEERRRLAQMIRQRETEKFIEILKLYPLTKQQLKTLRGQALAGDLEGAQRGLETIMTRREGNE